MNELQEYNLGEVNFFSSPLLDSMDFVEHAFGTRDSYPLNHSQQFLGKEIQDSNLLSMLFKGKKLSSSMFESYCKSFIHLKQIHSSKVISTSEIKKGSSNIADAVISNESGLILCIETADCLPVLIVDQNLKAIAAIHAGRKGILKGIIQETVKRLKSEYGCNPSDLSVAIGPGICGESYEVGRECIVPFNKSIPEADNTFFQKKNGKWYLDLAKIVTNQFLNLGIKKRRLGKSGPCTLANSKNFFSYRREGKGVGRQTSLILLV